MYEGPNEFEAKLRKGPKTKVVDPITIYRDPKTGYTFAHCTVSGVDDNPPSKLVKNGVEYELVFRAKESQHERSTE